MKISCDWSSGNAWRILAKKKKFWWIALFMILESILLTIYSTPQIMLQVDRSVLSQIPPLYWLEFFCATSVVCYLAFGFKNNPLEIFFLILLYYVILYSSNLFFSAPYQQTDSLIYKFIEILRDTDSIGMREISIEGYFEWPIFFVFTKILDQFLDLNSLQLVSSGLFILVFIFVISLFFFSYRQDVKVKQGFFLFLIPSLYIVLSYHFIVDQFAPQFMAFILAIFALAIYYGTRRSKFNVLFIILYSALVFTHPFFYIFVFVPIFIDKIIDVLSKRKYNASGSSKIQWNFVILMFVIWGVGFLYRFYSLYPNIKNLVYHTGFGVGETLTPLWNFFGFVHSAGEEVHPLYRLTPELFHTILSTCSRVLLIILIFIIMFSFIINRKQIRIETTDKSVAITGIAAYAVGIYTIFLGQRALQVIALPVSKVSSMAIGNTRKLSKLVMIILVIAPTLFTLTTVTNISIDGGLFVHDEGMISAGIFLDNHIMEKARIFHYATAYPAGYPNNYYRTQDLSNLMEDPGSKLDMILLTSKTILRLEYFGVDRQELFDKWFRKSDMIYVNDFSQLVRNSDLSKSIISW